MRADEGRQLRIDFEGRPGRAGAEPRELPEAPTRARSNEADELDACVGNTRDLLERICSWDNMSEACARVVRNGGAGGVDGMEAATQAESIEFQTQELTATIMRDDSADRIWKFVGTDYTTEDCGSKRYVEEINS